MLCRLVPVALRSAYGLVPLAEEEVERETAHMKLRWVQGRSVAQHIAQHCYE